jgi:hypothetical protein
MGGSKKVQNSLRLFMARGMDHCLGGEGPFEFDTISVLEQWVEKGRTPDRVIAVHFPPKCGVRRAGSCAAAMCLPSGGEVQGLRWPGRCLQLCLREAIERRCDSPTRATNRESLLGFRKKSSPCL